MKKNKIKLPEQPKLDPEVEKEFMDARRAMRIAIKKRLENKNYDEER